MDREYAMVRQFDHRLVSNWDQHPILFLKREWKVIQKRTLTLKSFEDKVVLPGLRPLSLLVNRLRFCWHSVILAIRSTVSTLNEIISFEKDFFIKLILYVKSMKYSQKTSLLLRLQNSILKIIRRLYDYYNQTLLFGISLCLHFAKQMYLFTFFDKY